MKCLMLSALLFFAGCAWTPTPLYESEGLVVSQAGDVEVSDDGFQLRLWFGLKELAEKYPETIQRVGLPWVDGVESHRQPMDIPDYHTMTWEDDGTPRHHRRVNTVSPGKSEGAPWWSIPSAFKGVVMIDGWLDEDGKPMANRLYFKLGGKQGGRVVEERLELGLTYTLDWWSSNHPDNPRPGKALLRMTVSESFVEWSE